MTPALMKVNLFNLVNEFHPVTSTIECSQCLYGWNTLTSPANLPFVLPRGTLWCEKRWLTISRSLWVVMAQEDLGSWCRVKRTGLLQLLHKGPEPWNKQGLHRWSSFLTPRHDYYVAALLSRSQQHMQVYSFKNIQVHYKIYKIQKKNDSVCFEGSRVQCPQSFWLYRANRLNASNTGLDSKWASKPVAIPVDSL